jgi:hypothetical protein
MENQESDIKEHESGMKYRIFEDENGTELRVFASDSAARLEFEEYGEYKFRRQINKYLAKKYKRGHHFWPSVIPTQMGYMGNTYIKEKAERVKEEVIKKQKENEQED